MNPHVIKQALVCGLLFSSLLARAQDHGHLNVGAANAIAGSPLTWDNGSDFIATSDYVKTLEFTNAAKYAGYYQGNITLTALAQTPAFGGPVTGAPALGSVVVAKVQLISGPADGRFGFWDSTSTTQPTISVGVGETSAAVFRVTQGNGAPGEDPFGHIHGRRFTATKPGLYQVGFQAFDVSTNGPGGGPIHTPSEVIPVWFQAGVTIRSVEPDFEDGHVHIQFAAPVGRSWQVEATDSLSPADWQSAGPIVAGQDLFDEVMHLKPPGTLRFYRIREVVP